MSNYLILSNDPVACCPRGARRGNRIGNSTSRRVALINTLKTWTNRAQQRRQLANLPRHLLEDIGISAIDAAREAAKPFWVE